MNRLNTISPTASGALVCFVSERGLGMRKLVEMTKRFRREEDGAAMVEYTVLLGIITAGVILMVVAVSAWVTGT
jgi:pilus assembly protein Flp/PilA